MVYRALTPIRVLEFSDGVAGGYCGTLLAYYGAVVTKIEQVNGHPAGSVVACDADRRAQAAVDAYFRAHKRSMALDLHRADAREAALQLVAGSDIVVDDYPPGFLAELGLGYDDCSAVNPSVVYTSISAFGAVGPRSTMAATEIVVDATGGWMYGLGQTDREPLKPPGRQSEIMAAICAASGALGGYLAARESGVGDHIDVSRQACVAWFLMNPTTVYEYSGAIWRRDGGHSAWNYPQGIKPCKDGSIDVNVIYHVEWQRLCGLLGRPEWFTDPRLERPPDRVRNAAMIDEVLLPWLAEHTVDEIYRIAQENKVPFSPVNTVPDLLVSRQLDARGFWQRLESPVIGEFTAPGLPFKLVDVAEEQPSRPPLPARPTTSVERSSSRLDRPDDGHARRRLPLEGVRIVDLTMAWAGPMAVRTLAELGAYVVKIESAGHMDRWRGGYPPQRDAERYVDGEPGEQPWNRNSFFNTQNRNKRSLSLDLKTPQGREIFTRLVARADVVAENFSAGAMGRLGLEYDALRAIKSDLIMVSMPAFGKTGPERGYVAHGPTIEAAGGHLALQGYRGEPPTPSGTLAWGDPVAGMTGALAAMVALTYRSLTGKGTHVDLSHLESAIPFNFEAFLDYVATGRLHRPQGAFDSALAPQGCYPCAGDDRWIVLCCPDDERWRRLCDVIGAPDMAADPSFSGPGGRSAGADAIDARIAQWTSVRERGEVVEHLQVAGIPAGAVNDAADLLADPQLRDWGFFTAIQHPDAGTRRYPGMPWRAAGTPWTRTLPAPRFGEHNVEILVKDLGFTEEDVERFRAQGVIADVPVAQGD